MVDFVDLVNSNVGETYNMEDFDIQVTDKELFRMVISMFKIKYNHNYEFLKIDHIKHTMELQRKREIFRSV
jgi:hypothetical protein